MDHRDSKSEGDQDEVNVKIFEIIRDKREWDESRRGRESDVDENETNYTGRDIELKQNKQTISLNGNYL